MGMVEALGTAAQRVVLSRRVKHVEGMRKGCTRIGR
jgi:hypothetical protein